MWDVLCTKHVAVPVSYKPGLVLILVVVVATTEMGVQTVSTDYKAY